MKLVVALVITVMMIVLLYGCDRTIHGGVGWNLNSNGF